MFESTMPLKPNVHGRDQARMVLEVLCEEPPPEVREHEADVSAVLQPRDDEVYDLVVAWEASEEHRPCHVVLQGPPMHRIADGLETGALHVGITAPTGEQKPRDLL